uniref:Uncharacterized protein n=1 Tax=Aegilops tauschii subsp. strangulata TaxID=200361 RepID=A0A453R6X2_AEGTS
RLVCEELACMAPLLPPSPPSGSPRLLKSGSGSEWSVVAQRNVKSSLLLLLAISTVVAFSILYSSRSLTVARTAGEALTQSPLLAALDLSSRMPEDDDDQSDEPAFPADDSVTPEQSTPAEVVSLPAAAPSTVGEAAMQLEEKCDISRGKWVREPNGPVYTNLTCPMLPDFKNCQKFGKDDGHLYWRWQPDGCELPRFVPERFLDVVRGKRLAFIGDSLARNQIDSLLCLLSQAEAPVDVYSDAFDKYRTWHFPAHNFTLMVMWTEFYAHAVPVAGADGKPTSSFDIHLDRLGADWTSRLPGLDYAVISGGNWFFRVNYLWEGGRRIGCLNCAGNDANLTDFGVAYAVRRVVRAAVEGIAQCRGCKTSLVTFLRTYSPDHFEHGSWFDGGYCNRTAPLQEREVSMESIAWELRRVQREEVRRVRATKRRFGVLDVTKAMMMRADGHPDNHFDIRWRRNGSDCLHWCLPGPVDMWNGVLLQRLAELTPPPAAR